ncbi:hypothetical protein AAMO2058_000001600 [Amorphochlora amoebiformis]
MRSKEILDGSRALIEAYSLINKLGEGKFVELWRAAPADAPDKVVCLHIVRPEHTDSLKAHYEQETLKIGKIFDHKNLVRTRPWEGPESTNRLWRVSEFCSGGSLKDMRNLGKLHEKHISHALYCALRALSYLHENNITHGNVSADNLLLTETFDVKLGDLGVHDLFVERSESTNIRDHLKLGNLVRNAQWMAPEYFEGKAVGVESDIWAVGITALELANGNPPLFGVGLERLIHTRTKGPPPVLVSKKKNRWSEDFCDFIRCCLIKDAQMRPLASKLKTHTFMHIRNWSSMNGRSSYQPSGPPVVEERW